MDTEQPKEQQHFRLGATTPPRKRLSPKTSLTLDLSKLPPVAQPTQPTNTVLITNLQDASLFEAPKQSAIRSKIEMTAPVHTWVPLKSFRRILASFASADEASAVRRAWDNATIEGERVRVFYGPNLSQAQFNGPQHLALPDAGKLFFISPPPSPPASWEMKLEDAPNKLVHADDLAAVLEKLHRHSNEWELNADIAMTPLDDEEAGVSPAAATAAPIQQRGKRSRSSTLIYHPDQHGSSPDLPAIAVMDLTDEPEDVDMDAGINTKPIMAHTARPPVELMDQ